MRSLARVLRILTKVAQAPPNEQPRRPPLKLPLAAWSCQCDKQVSRSEPPKTARGARAPNETHRIQKAIPLKPEVDPSSRKSVRAGGTRGWLHRP
jgi:hypothetical protein